MLIREYKEKFRKELLPYYDTMEVDSFFYLLLEAFQNLRRVDLALNSNLELEDHSLARWDSALSDLKSHKPVQYIIGETTFYGLPFHVSEATLIPRPETEELVDCIVKESSYKKGLKILDIGTGTGCIAISLAKNIPDAQVFAMDVSAEALKIAQKNAVLNKVQIGFIHQSVLEIENLNRTYDVIVSNPPYVRNLEKAEIKKNVLDYEPHLALFVEDEDALLFYRKISELAQLYLSENGKLYFEINQYLSSEMVDLLQKKGFKAIDLKKDIYGNFRMISAQK